MDTAARTAPPEARISMIATAFRWATRLAVASAVGATVTPITLAPEGFAGCVPPEAETASLACLGDAGLGLAAALAGLAVAFAVLSALVRRYQRRVEDRLLVVEVRSAAARGLRGSG
ncbi:hypothetical protein GCM10010964_42870 [Caldovatus sediminis]|uniref:Uncharacterized protein n=1 Tax=Caldovatus sediminis TaxID=2041189 RepID=A0A8J2ZFQ4_9PROT|nr:hypothetical protein [Caldovatus sediminis]GGG51030.1 hypothetical protein GCM10010964_42870 [Caldovatus sediminis]